MTKNVDRKYLRARSADFVKGMVEISQRKEAPASAEAPIVDVKKIEDITMKLKEQTADKSKSYWEKPVATPQHKVPDLYDLARKKQLEKKLQK